jgi:hypothetical protein
MIERDRVSFHQSLRCPRVLAFEEPLFNVIRQLKAAHPDLPSHRYLTQTHHMPTVANQYHYSNLAQNNVTIVAGALMSTSTTARAKVHLQHPRPG